MTTREPLSSEQLRELEFGQMVKFEYGGRTSYMTVTEPYGPHTVDGETEYGVLCVVPSRAGDEAHTLVLTYELLTSGDFYFATPRETRIRALVESASDDLKRTPGAEAALLDRIMNDED